MAFAFRSFAYTVCFAIGAMGVSACQNSVATDDEGAAPIVIQMKQGEVLQLIAPEARADDAAARQAYYNAAFPIAESFGFKRLGQLNITQKVISDYDPGAFIFFSWPNENAVNDFANHPQQPSLKAMRSEAWTELKIYNDVLEGDLTLSFDPSKHYTVVVAWFDPAHPGDYERYLTGIESAVNRESGRFIYKMRNPSFEANASPMVAPGQITFVEWDDTDGFARVQKSSEYKANAQFFNSGLDRFEFYWLKP